MIKTKQHQVQQDIEVAAQCDCCKKEYSKNDYEYHEIFRLDFVAGYASAFGDGKRIQLALAFTWCLVVGHWKYGEVSQLPLNKHGRPAKSLFRLGLDLLRRVLKNYCTKKQSG